MNHQAGLPAVASLVAPRALRAGDRVFLADQDPVRPVLTDAALRECGWRVLQLASTQEAPALFVRERAHAVVLGAALSVTDSLASCQRLRIPHGGQDVPVLALTGVDNDQAIARAYRMGATDFAIKIDDSFMADLQFNRNRATLVWAIIAMATALYLRTIAQAVETTKPMQSPREQGYTLTQGFVCARLLLAEKIMLLAGSFSGRSVSVGEGRIVLFECASAWRQP